ncbi:hypothetical protein [Seleniivibrio woodruffii]|uniref:Uncharacterized protein n=1 Tax=Seleniivibrio woodruffii TaxID=1078050 RepID=A0A4R1K5V4_9BACT|nr:hypothetical protein [Seleniivibrio woodruffii]TCK59585.1 hypothetical protein C8D98_2519 [Seleniivibrio woodruffii]TVZ35374.1 hypothetical protein OF66_0989 [Seleniivibrio woodruffii]
MSSSFCTLISNIEPEWVMILVTIVYVYFSYQLTKETKQLRILGTSPELSIHMQSFKRSTHLEIVIQNIGKGIAYNTEVSFDKTFINTIHEYAKHLPEVIKISHFAPGQQIAYLVCAYQNLPDGDNSFFDMTIQYEKEDKKMITKKIRYNYSFLKGSDVSIPYELEKQKQMFENLGKTINNGIKVLSKDIVKELQSMKDNYK